MWVDAKEKKVEIRAGWDGRRVIPLFSSLQGMRVSRRYF